MAKKAELLEQASKLKLDVNSKSTIAEIEAAIQNAQDSSSVVSDEAQGSDEQRSEVHEDAHTASSADDDAVIRTEKTAKAGKRSEKALKEVEEKLEKEARKESGDTTPKDEEAVAKKKGPEPKSRPTIERRGKKYQELAKQIEKDKLYPLAEALELATKTSPSKFDASVEVHVRLGVDPRQADQNIRATVSLPHGTGKTIRVAVFAPSDQHEAAKKAGADVVGEEDFLQQLDKEEINFDVLISTPQLMPKLGKYARVLGPRGLMPNPKSGTVSANVAAAVKDAKTGKIEYRVDKQAIVHTAIGKVSFGAAKLNDNAKAFIDSLQAQKPNSIKGIYINTVTVTTTQGPGIKVAL